jgi:putative transposase
MCHRTFITPSRRDAAKRGRAVSVPGPSSKSWKRVRRADVFDIPANTKKYQAVCALWPLWRRGLHAEAFLAREDLFAGREIKKSLSAAEEAANDRINNAKKDLGSAQQQMVRAQALGMVGSWLSNRVNDFREIVSARYTPSRWKGHVRDRFQSLPDDAQARHAAALDILRHELYAINLKKAWLLDTSVVVTRQTDDGDEVPVSDQSRKLAKTMFMGLMQRHKWPRFQSLCMKMDHRLAKVEIAERGLFPYWITISFKKEKTRLPVYGWGRDGQGLDRRGQLGRSVNIFLSKTGALQCALTRDVTEEYTASAAAYEPKMDVLGLDFGLTTLFATSDGDLLGRDYMRKLAPLIAKADAIAAKLQRAGVRPGRDPSYRAAIEAVQGFLQTEINRVLNKVVAQKRPRVLVVERLNFKAAGLGRRMNRILSSCGRNVVAKKLLDLKERFGIEVHEIDPAYSSKSCSGCGYVDPRNRTKQDTFHCRACGKKLHADVNAARNLAQSWSRNAQSSCTENSRRSATTGAGGNGRQSSRKRKASSYPLTRNLRLQVLMVRYDERNPTLSDVSWHRRGRMGARESAPDPRLTNPYWKRKRKERSEAKGDQCVTYVAVGT